LRLAAAASARTRLSTAWLSRKRLWRANSSHFLVASAEARASSGSDLSACASACDRATRQKAD
jgi:hypothetical protein